MAKWKIIEQKVKNKQRNITFEEMVLLLEHYGYVQESKGKTSGSRMKFTFEGHADILMHRPHPQKELKEYIVKDIHDLLESEGFWNE